MTRFDQRMKELGYSILHDREREGGEVESRIQDLERQIGAQLPPDYRDFLTVYGGAAFPKTFEAPITESGHFDEYACPDVFFGFYKPDASGTPHSLDLPDNLRYYKSRIPKGSIPIAQAIGGNLICLAVAGSNRGSVYYWDHETCSLWLVADSFGAFLEALAQSNSEEDDNGEE